MNARMRIVALPLDEYGIVIDRMKDGGIRPPVIPTLDAQGSLTGRHKPANMEKALGARFVFWLEGEIDIESSDG
jgi:hypothetical protein